jgi:hypothetical protein
MKKLKRKRPESTLTSTMTQRKLAKQTLMQKKPSNKKASLATIEPSLNNLCNSKWATNERRNNEKP